MAHPGTGGAPPTLAEPPERLAVSALAALAVAAAVLVLAVLPAEYGIDPTGFGGLAGFTALRGGGTAEAAPGNATLGPRPVFQASATWSLMEHVVTEVEGYATPRADERIPLRLGLANVTSVTARLTWVDDPGSAPDIVEVSVRSPSRTYAPWVQGTSGHDGRGEAASTLAFRPAPFPGGLEGDGPVTIERATDTSSDGEWVVVVRMLEAGPHAGGAADPGNAFVLRVTAETYEASVQRTDLERGPWDEARLVLQPGRGVEYKFAMSEGAAMRYEWNATAPLRSDLHGEPAGQPGNATSHRRLDGAGDEGSLVAPFTGTHGWHWANPGDQPVEVTLRTRGAYRIVGAV